MAPVAKLVVRLERGNRRKFIRNLSRRPSGLEAPVQERDQQTDFGQEELQLEEVRLPGAYLQ